ncbi:DNA-binding transcriptional regulator [Rubellicoccus peritrichatus]|uniref:DNA-binding transcriptional regulator n=1 Tax=Rubellicoccus peritrichatus TaxID=3080537 RepID=A0AAQ3QTH6_9BACT|nr:DNA-binding transcriptional regulator [Puniceicoccus sp. CR14]WOO41356.1 DNA-binding transcriptional regulator [Puniceicoccus sp. CR14]
MKSVLPSAPRIALLMEGTRNYERGLLRGIAKYTNLHGPWQFYRHVPYLPDQHVSPVELVRTWQPDGLIIRESEHYDELLDLPMPVMYVPTTEPRSGLSNIVVNDYAVGRMAAQHLYESGLRHFAFCGMNALFFWSRLRCEGFCETLSEYGHEVSIFESSQGDEFLNRNDEFETLQQWLRDLPSQTGLMVCTDDFSLLVQEACLAVGRSIPEEIALIGVGNDEAVCDLTTTPMSSVSLNTERAGYDAAEQLARQLSRGTRRSHKQTKPVNVVVEPLRVVARRSTDATLTFDPDVSTAIAFINERINYPIEVNDVVNAVSLSRRALYDHFKSVTGQTISAYIRERRVEHFARLLLETNLTIAEIAYAMGYDTDTNIARLFQKTRGMTPHAFRRKFGGNTTTG